MKQGFKYFLAILLFFGLYFVVWERVGGFEKEKAESDLGSLPEWEVAVGDIDLQKILSQRFTYLGKGVQSYAFLSADGTTVLKLFKHYHMWPSNQLFKQLPLPSSYRQKVLEHREKRMQRILGSCHLAFKEYREEAGLLYLHLNKTEGLPILTLSDRLGRTHYLDLNRTEFALQKRAEPLYATLDAWMEKGDLKESKKAISSLFDLVLIRYQKKIKNKDPSLDRNFGLINGHAVQIDIGSLSKREEDASPEKAKREALKTATRLKKWLGKRSPLLNAFIDEEVQRVSESLQ